MNEDPKVTIIGQVENWPRVFFDGAEPPFPIRDVEWEMLYGQQYITVRIPVREVTFRPHD